MRYLISACLFVALSGCGGNDNGQLPVENESDTATPEATPQRHRHSITWGGHPRELDNTDKMVAHYDDQGTKERFNRMVEMGFEVVRYETDPNGGVWALLEGDDAAQRDYENWQHELKNASGQADEQPGDR